MSEFENDMARSLKVIKNILVVFLGIVILYLLKVLSNLFLPLAFALFFAILLQPLVGLFRRKFSLNLSVVFTTIVSVIVFLALGFVFYNAVSSFIANRDQILNGVTAELKPVIDEISRLLGAEMNDDELKSYISRVIPTDKVLSMSGSFLNTISGFATELLMTILYFAGLLSAIAEYEKVIDYIMGKNGEEHSVASDTFRRVKDSISIYIKVKTIVSLLTGLGIGLVSWFFGIQYAFLWGILAFVLNYIPYVGSLIAIVPPLLIGGLTADSVSEFVFLFICLEAIQIVMGSIIEPKMTGESLSINTVTILFSLVFWSFMWGTAGMLLSVPMTFLIKVILEHVSDAGFFVRLMDKKTGKELG
ncbi:AI-2E family transporter [Marinoscillum pacificum]|uniref:AI-2E family transporter n=1 Tax=Marinoscillum pacificum TaxID=392723 RepID=UPI0021583DCF|nr:AI-2E family transporter [Marinoscillum pacificum]|tara:strand:- start:298 stop:1380 length:1083 start_codon:yes stop_codon:yes gene_type:complete